MVAFNVPKLGCVVPLNFSRNILFECCDCVAKGDLIGASIRLREATRRQLYAMALYWGVLPKQLADKQYKKIKPRALVRGLLKARVINKDASETFLEILRSSDAAFNWELVTGDVRYIRTSIDMLHMIIDCDPCGETFERLHSPPPLASWWPAASDTDDDDDDESGNAWTKGGAV